MAEAALPAPWPHGSCSPGASQLTRLLSGSQLTEDYNPAGGGSERGGGVEFDSWLFWGRGLTAGGPVVTAQPEPQAVRPHCGTHTGSFNVKELKDDHRFGPPAGSGGARRPAAV